MTKMITKICMFINKVSDLFPIGGGATGALYGFEKISFFPTFEALIIIIFTAVIGSFIGWCVKKLLDYFFNKYFKKRK